jgi:hypothetical protein
MMNTADVPGGKPAAVRSQSILGISAINPLVAFTTSMEDKKRCYYFILYRTPHETQLYSNLYSWLNYFCYKWVTPSNIPDVSLSADGVWVLWHVSFDTKAFVVRNKRNSES